MSTITISPPRRAILALALAVALAFGLAGTAQAKWLAGVTGQSTVTPSAQLKAFLAAKNVSAAPVAPATADASNAYTFPIASGVVNNRTNMGVLVHRGGIRFTRGERSLVVRHLVVVRTRGRGYVLAQIPGKGSCKRVKRGLRRYAKQHPAQLRGAMKLAARHPQAARKLRRALVRYCEGGKVIVLARTVNQSKSVSGTTATLRADLVLARDAARLINRAVGTKVVRAGAPLGSGVATVTIEKKGDTYVDPFGK